MVKLYPEKNVYLNLCNTCIDRLDMYFMKSPGVLLIVVWTVCLECLESTLINVPSDDINEKIHVHLNCSPVLAPLPKTRTKADSMPDLHKLLIDQVSLDNIPIGQQGLCRLVLRAMEKCNCFVI